MEELVGRLYSDLDEAIEERVARLELEIEMRDEQIVDIKKANSQLHHVVNRLTEEIGELYYQMAQE